MNRPRQPGVAARPPHLHLRSIGLVILGGTLGTAAREALTLAFPPVNGVPFAILTINVCGAFLLGLLLESLVRAGGEEIRHRNVRMLAGTGFLGGFTTYSALATDSALLLGGGSGAGGGEAVGGPLAGILYALGTVVIGGIASWGGIATAAAIRRGKTGERS
ncbi:fluoride efflux transporter FluC [Leucobacter sp. GX24907]